MLCSLLHGAHETSQATAIGRFFKQAVIIPLTADDRR
jgi:hypothetical protein